MATIASGSAPGKTPKYTKLSAKRLDTRVNVQHSANMREHDTGEGRLVSLAADSRVYMVDYVLDVDTEVTGESAKFSPPRVQRRYSLQVKARNSETISDGEFTLKTSGEILRVRKTGPTWKVILP